MQALLISLLLLAPPVAASSQGSAVKAAKGHSALKFEVAPKATVIYVDGRKKGSAGKVHKVRVKPGKHDVRLVFNKDETEFEINVQKAQEIVVKYAFEDSGRPAPKVPEKKPAPDKKAPKEKPAPSQPKPDQQGPHDEPYDDFDSDIPR